MKTLSLARPLILIVVGLPGAGKSFFARQFSEMFSAPLVSYDRLRAELFREHQFSTEEQELLERLVMQQIHELVKTHRSFIVDGGSNTRAGRQRLAQIAKTHQYDTLAIWVQTDESTCRQRAIRRKQGRSEDDILPKITEQQWAAHAKRFHQPTRESYMVISGKHAFSTQAKMVLRKLAAPRVEEAETAHQTERQETTRETTGRQPRPEGARPRRRNLLIS